jgi:hypothetical protein
MEPEGGVRGGVDRWSGKQNESRSVEVELHRRIGNVGTIRCGN